MLIPSHQESNLHQELSLQLVPQELQEDLDSESEVQGSELEDLDLLEDQASAQLEELASSVDHLDMATEELSLELEEVLILTQSPLEFKPDQVLLQLQDQPPLDHSERDHTYSHQILDRNLSFLTHYAPININTVISSPKYHHYYCDIQDK